MLLAKGFSPRLSLAHYTGEARGHGGFLVGTLEASGLDSVGRVGSREAQGWEGEYPPS